jgi:anti-sigma regulatory factor (Ser/Thr protein kinase)
MFAADPSSVGAARRFATAALADADPEVVEAVELMVSELATNSIRHVQSSFEMTIRHSTEEIVVEVVDYGGGTPVMRSPRPEDPSGRGLRIVDMLAARWGVKRGSGIGKTVWFAVTTKRRGEAVVVEAEAGRDRLRSA